MLSDKVPDIRAAKTNTERIFMLYEYLQRQNAELRLRLQSISRENLAPDLEKTIEKLEKAIEPKE